MSTGQIILAVVLWWLVHVAIISIIDAIRDGHGYSMDSFAIGALGAIPVMLAEVVVVAIIAKW